MKTLCIFKQYKKTEIMSFAIKTPIYFKYFILPSISESPNSHEWRLLVQDTVEGPPKHKLKFELGNPIIVVPNLENNIHFTTPQWQTGSVQKSVYSLNATFSDHTFMIIYVLKKIKVLFYNCPKIPEKCMQQHSIGSEDPRIPFPNKNQYPVQKNYWQRQY